MFVVVPNESSKKYTGILFTNEEDAERFIEVNDLTYYTVVERGVDDPDVMPTIALTDIMWVVHAVGEPFQEERYRWAASRLTKANEEYFGNPEKWVNGVIPNFNALGRAVWQAEQYPFYVIYCGLVLAETQEQAESLAAYTFGEYMDELWNTAIEEAISILEDRKLCY